MTTAAGHLAGKTVAITGGARGIGRATAAAFATAGAKVAIGDVDAELVAKTAAGLGPNVVGLALDVTDAAAFETFLTEAETRLGPLAVLVNNAGIMPTGAFLEEPDAVADRQIDINLRGVIIGSKLAGRRFVERGGGHLVNVASTAGIAAAPGVVTYCATKYAVVGLDEALRQELGGNGVQVTTILPGFVQTELIAGLSPNWLTRQIGQVEPEDVACGIVAAVASGRSGQVFVPRRAGAALRAMGTLPRPVRDLLTSALGGDKVMVSADETARAAYRRRSEGTGK